MIKDPVRYSENGGKDGFPTWEDIVAGGNLTGLLFSHCDSGIHLTKHFSRSIYNYNILFLIEKKSGRYSFESLSMPKEVWFQKLSETYPEYANWFLYHPEWL